MTGVPSGSSSSGRRQVTGLAQRTGQVVVDGLADDGMGEPHRVVEDVQPDQVGGRLAGSGQVEARETRDRGDRWSLAEDGRRLGEGDGRGPGPGDADEDQAPDRPGCELGEHGGARGRRFDALAGRRKVAA